MGPIQLCAAVLALGVLAGCSGGLTGKLGELQPTIREKVAEIGAQDGMIFGMNVLACQRHARASDDLRVIALLGPEEKRKGNNDLADESLRRYQGCVKQLQTTRERGVAPQVIQLQ